MLNEKEALMNNWTCITQTGAQRTRFDEVPKYAEGLYDLGNQTYAWMVPNGSWGESNTGLIVGEGESLLIDTLWDLKYTQAMLDAMRPVMDAAPLKVVVNTHADGDHFWGNELVTPAEIITSQASYEEMLNIQPKSMIMLGKVGKLASALRILGADKVGRWFQGMVAPYDYQAVTQTLPTRTFEDALTLHVGGRAVHLMEVGPAHTQGDLMVYIPDTKTLYTSDILFIGSTPVTWAGPIENWVAALDRILEMDVNAIVPGHGPITDKDGVRQVKAYWKYVAGEVRSRYDAGMSPQDAAHDIVLSKDFARQSFVDWNSPERIMTSTHTIYRNLQGRTDHPKVPELMNIMRKQALLAHKLPDAQPAVMRKG
jgi:glyoxylase-like metal-dependent hydrolase (beta-lactamase superfamily II)